MKTLRPSRETRHTANDHINLRRNSPTQSTLHPEQWSLI